MQILYGKNEGLPLAPAETQLSERVKGSGFDCLWGERSKSLSTILHTEEKK